MDALWHWYHAEVCQDQPDGTVKRIAIACDEATAELIAAEHNRATQPQPPK